MSAQDDLQQAEVLSLVAFVGMLFLTCCGNTSRYVNQNKEPEKVPVKIEHRESPATNQVYQVRSSYLIHVR